MATRALPCWIALLVLLQPAQASLLIPPPGDRDVLLVARERGGGRGGAARRPGGDRRARSGLGQRQAALDRGNRRPDGGWGRQLGDRDRARRQFDRGLKDLDRRDRSAERWRDGLDRMDQDAVRRRFERVDKNWDRARRELRKDWRDDWRDDWRALDRRVDRAVNRLERWDDHWPGWVRPGWALARPWTTGWYGGWVRPPWGWWGGRSLAWGLGSLATAAVINEAVDQAIAASRPTIVVPDSGYTLVYNSIEPSAEESVRFVAVTGETRFEATADCRSGELNGREPASAAQAQLINAACQVAYGS